MVDFCRVSAQDEADPDSLGFDLSHPVTDHPEENPSINHRHKIATTGRPRTQSAAQLRLPSSATLWIPLHLRPAPSVTSTNYVLNHRRMHMILRSHRLHFSHPGFF